MIVFILVIMIVMGCTACGGNQKNNEKPVPKNNEKDASFENSNTNLVNTGLVVKQGDWLYYSLSDGLYKKNIDGTQQQKLCEGYEGTEVYEINVVNDWVYFMSLGLYRVRTDGTDYEQLDVEDKRGVKVVGDWIYYGRDYRMKTDGSHKEQIYDSHVGAAYTFNAVGDWLYFYDCDENDNEFIYRLKTDGSDLQEIYEGRANCVVVDDGWVYFDEYDKSGHLCKMRIDGTDFEEIIDDSIMSIDVDDEWIYYNGDNELCKIKKDGTNKQMLYAENAQDITVIDDWIYYDVLGEKATTIYRIKIDGSGREIFAQDVE